MKRALQDRRFPPGQSSTPESRSPPVRGWNTRDSLAAMRPEYAVLLDNWIPRSLWVEMRKGAEEHSTGFSAEVETLMAYRPSSGAGKLFAASDTGIFDVTSGGAIGAAVSAITNAKLQHVNFATSAGQFLCAVNGTDDYRYYDGATWTTVPTFTFGAGTLDTNTLIGVTVHQSRLFFIPKNSLKFYFMDLVGTIFGTVDVFHLDQVFTMGGYLMAMGSWTFDGGDGPEDRAVFISSEGQVAVYTGTDPGEAASWTLAGTFFIGRPVGRRCLMKMAGDLVVLTERGLYPLSKALASATINRTIALSDPIEPTIAQQAQILMNTFGWQVLLHTAQNLLIVTVPSTPRVMYAMDLLSKAWCRLKGWDALCMEVFDGFLYYGSSTAVVRAFSGVSDFGNQIEAELMSAYDYFSTRGQSKQIKLIRPHFRAAGGFSLLLGGNTDFGVEVPRAVLEVVPGGDTAVWDTALWDEAVWSADATVAGDWQTVGTRPGFNFSLYVKVASATTTPALVAVDYLLTKGSAL